MHLAVLNEDDCKKPLLAELIHPDPSFQNASERYWQPHCLREKALTHRHHRGERDETEMVGGAGMLGHGLLYPNRPLGSHNDLHNNLR